MRYVLWQRDRSPSCIIGSIEAASPVAAADLARAMYGSFALLLWEDACSSEQQEAERRDALVDALAAEMRV